MTTSITNNIIRGFALILENSQKDLLHEARHYLPVAKGLSEKTNYSEYDRMAEKYSKIIGEVDKLVICDLDHDSSAVSQLLRSGNDLKNLVHSLRSSVRNIARQLEKDCYIHLIIAGSAYNGDGDTVVSCPAHDTAMALERLFSISCDKNKQLEDLEHIMFKMVDDLVDLAWGF